MSAAEVVRFAGRSRLAHAQPHADSEMSYIYQRAPGQRQGRVHRSLDGLDAAVTHLKDVVESELLLVDG